MNRTLTISPVTTLFDFHPFEAHRVGGIIVISHVSRTPDGQERRAFAALGTCLGGEEGEVKIIGTYCRRRTKKELARSPRKKNAARVRRHPSVRVPPPDAGTRKRRQRWNKHKAASRARKQAAVEAARIAQEINMETIGEFLPKEMARVRDEVMPAYIEIGASGRFALAMMRADLNTAAKALAEGDVVEMLRVYQSLKEYHV